MSGSDAKFTAAVDTLLASAWQFEDALLDAANCDLVKRLKTVEAEEDELLRLYDSRAARLARAKATAAWSEDQQIQEIAARLDLIDWQLRQTARDHERYRRARRGKR